MEDARTSFECVSRGGARRLESCGPLQRRIRVHANDESYAAARDRMESTIAAEQRKRVCVIKPNQTDIGLRVNVRTAHPHSVAGPTQLARQAERPDQPEWPGRAKQHERLERPVTPAARPKTQPAVPTPQKYAQHQQHPLNTDKPQRLPTKPGLTRRNLKESFIQLLALKAFKKLEIYSKLSSQGIKNKERSLVKHMLPVISTFTDNCYHLKVSIWNDVHVDWPFYSEEEKQMVKARKPHNLSPSLSSCSAESLPPRASPSSGKRAGSAAGLVSLPAGAPITARGAVAAASVSVLSDEPPPKKQRISHYRRPAPPSSGYATTSSSERQAEDRRPSPVNMKANSFKSSQKKIPEPKPDIIKQIALRKVFGPRAKKRI